MDIGGWLRGLGLERYAEAFRANEIDLRVLPELTADDLKELGVAAIGHRRLLLKAIADLADGAGRAAAGDVPAAFPAPAGGSPLPHPPPQAGEGRVGGEAERRQLTVMFVDLIESTRRRALRSRGAARDPRPLPRCVAATVARYGRIAPKYIGDGVLIYFGYPRRIRTTPSAPPAPGSRSSTRSAGSLHKSR